MFARRCTGEASEPCGLARRNPCDCTVAGWPRVLWRGGSPDAPVRPCRQRCLTRPARGCVGHIGARFATCGGAARNNAIDAPSYSDRESERARTRRRSRLPHRTAVRPPSRPCPPRRRSSRRQRHHRRPRGSWWQQMNSTVSSSTPRDGAPSKECPGAVGPRCGTPPWCRSVKESCI